MAPDRLGRFLAARPFRRFVVHLGDGRGLIVDHPEMATLLKGGRTLLLSTSDGSSHLLDVFLITGIEVKTAADWEGAAELIL